MKIKVYSILLLIFSVFSLSGDVWLHKEGGVRLWLPGNWTPRAGGRVMTASSPGEELFFLCSTLEARDLEEGKAEIREIVPQFITLAEDLTTFSRRKEENRESLRLSTSGEAVSIPVKIEVYLTRLAPGRVIFVLIIIKQEAGNKFSPTLEQIYRSLRLTEGHH